MAIKHAYVNSVADDPAATATGKVTPTRWNDDHTIDDGTVTYAKMQQVSAANRILGNLAAGAGPVAELTASQIFDMVSNTNGVLLTRTGGTWAPVANVTTDNGDLVIANNASPVAPSAGAKLFGRSVSGRPMLAAFPSVGSRYDLQPLIGRRSIAQWVPRSGTTTMDVQGCTASAAVGTPTARAIASTNMFTSLPRLGYVSAAAINSAAGTVDNNSFWAWRGNAAGLGGFFVVIRFGVSDAVLNPNGAMIAGLSTTAVIGGQPSAMTNVIGVGCDSGDTVLQLYAAGSSAQARTSLGANFPVNTISTDVYELILYAAPNASSVSYQVTRLNTGDVASGTISNAANLPSNTTFLGPICERFSGATATAVGIDVFGMYAERGG